MLEVRNRQSCGFDALVASMSSLKSRCWLSFLRGRLPCGATYVLESLMIDQTKGMLVLDQGFFVSLSEACKISVLVHSCLPLKDNASHCNIIDQWKKQSHAK